MLKKYLENRGIDKDTILTSPMTGRKFSIERLIIALEKKGKEQNLISTIEILPFKDNNRLLKSFLTGIGETYIMNNAI
jgi:hypothetical protein